MSAGLLETDTMFSVRERPWHGLGAILKKAPKNTREALRLAGLDWKVEKEEIYRMDGKTPVVIPDQFAMTRDRDRKVLGIVSERYTPVQNVEAFNFLDGIFGEVVFETAGSLWDGRRIWAMIRLPKHIEIAGDTVVPYAMVTTTHDGTGSVQVAVTPQRVVCWNTLAWALAAAKSKYSVRHLGDPTTKLHEARAALDVTVNYYEQFQKTGLKLASAKITERKLTKVLEDLYPTPEGAGTRTQRNRLQAREQVMTLFVAGKTIGNAPGSKWAAINAIAERQDWYSNVRGNEDKRAEARFVRATDDPDGIKARAFKLVAAA